MASGRGARARGHSRDGPVVRRGRRRARAVPHVQSKVWGELDRATHVVVSCFNNQLAMEAMVNEPNDSITAVWFLSFKSQFEPIGVH